MTTSVVPFSAIARLDLVAALADAEGQLTPSSRRMYRIDAEQFAAWMLERGLTPKTLTRSDMIAYRAYLQETYRKATAERKLVVARRLLEELVIGEVLAKSPAYKVKGFKLDDETPHVVLTEQEAQALLDMIDIGTLLGQRDYVVILLLLRTGLRRSEAAQLLISDMVGADTDSYDGLLMFKAFIAIKLAYFKLTFRFQSQESIEGSTVLLQRTLLICDNAHTSRRPPLLSSNALSAQTTCAILGQIPE